MPAQDIAMGRFGNVVASLKPGVGAASALAELHVLEKRAQEGRALRSLRPATGLRGLSRWRIA